jgi:SAM-dependent methyltransferase
MDTTLFWDKKHQKYASQEWITKPTIFAIQTLSYFPTSGRLLDLGCGQGQDSIYFAKKGYKVVAGDFSETALQLARERAYPELENNLTFQTMDLSVPLDFAAESFDIVYSHLAFQYFDFKRTQELFDEIHAILKPGGVFAALLNTIDDPETNEAKQLEPELYEVGGIVKRFFSLESTKKFANKFEILLVDNKGETYKDEIKTLIRFVGRKAFT